MTANRYRQAVEFAESADRAMLIGDVHEDEPCFDGDSLVLVQHEDGTSLFFRSAFIRLYREYICVFTEHHGVLVYHRGDLAFWEQYRAEGARPKLKGSGHTDSCSECGEVFGVDELAYERHPDWRRDDVVAMCGPCEKRMDGDDS